LQVNKKKVAVEEENLDYFVPTSKVDIQNISM